MRGFLLWFMNDCAMLMANYVHTLILTLQHSLLDDVLYYDMILNGVYIDSVCCCNNP